MLHTLKENKMMDRLILGPIDKAQDYQDLLVTTVNNNIHNAREMKLGPDCKLKIFLELQWASYGILKQAIVFESVCII